MCEEAPRHFQQAAVEDLGLYPGIGRQGRERADELHIRVRYAVLVRTIPTRVGRTFVLGSRYDWHFIFDHEGEFQYRTKLPAATTPDDLLQHLTHRRWVLFNPSRMFPGARQQGLLFFCDWTFTLSERWPGKKLFACDELQVLTGTNVFPHELALVMDTGRRQGIDPVFVSQRPNRIHNSILDALTEVVAFAHRHKNAVDFLEDWGFDGDEVRGLRRGEFIALTDAGGEQLGSVF